MKAAILAISLAASSSLPFQEEWSEFIQLITKGNCKEIVGYAELSQRRSMLMATLYDTGTCFEKNATEAMRHYQAAAESGETEAMYTLWMKTAMRVDSETPPTEPEKDIARDWLTKAADLNNWRAAYTLSVCYKEGCWGFPKNESKAEHYKDVADKYRPNQRAQSAPSGLGPR